MADATSFLVVEFDEQTKNKRVDALFPHGVVTLPWRQGNLGLHALTEGTITIANTGQATDTFVGFDTNPLFSFQENAVFNDALGNRNKPKQYLLGYLFTFDHTTTSPDTDAGTTEIEILIRRGFGTAPTYSEKANAAVRIKLQSRVTVSVAAKITEPYCGPFVFPLRKAIALKKGGNITEYVCAAGMLNRASDAAHTAVTTYTLKVTGWAIVADLGVIQGQRLAEFWKEFLQ